jgi:serine/threonine-protein kinase
MEYVSGITLAERIQLGPLREEEALSVLRQVCDALFAAHERGVVHRDLKPGNIMIDAHHRVTVMDFGLASDLREDSASGVLCGTPAYWAPEQARGARATPKTDIYALGLVAVELLGGERPVLGQTPNLDVIPQDYRWAVRGCLRADPDKRFSSAAEVRDAFGATRQIAASDVAMARQNAVFVRALPDTPAWRHPVAVAGLAIALIGAALGLLPWAAGSRAPPRVFEGVRSTSVQAAVARPEPKPEIERSENVPSLGSEVQAAESGDAGVDLSELRKPAFLRRRPKP